MCFWQHSKKCTAMIRYHLKSCLNSLTIFYHIEQYIIVWNDKIKSLSNNILINFSSFSDDSNNNILFNLLPQKGTSCPLQNEQSAMPLIGL